MKMLLDELDSRLLELLTEDASCTNVSLARKLGVTSGTVRNRIKRLVDNGVLQIVAVVDPLKVGYQLQIISGIEVDLNKGQHVAHALASLEEVTYVGFTTGEFDLIMVASLRSSEELAHFLTERIPKIDGIRRIRTNQVLNTVKRTFRYDRKLLDRVNQLEETSDDEAIGQSPSIASH
jgi:Lrp/AsnC family transcriptional regulator, regulator for asnA, asnC and gidA